jgi:hypothetical protein
MSKCYLTPNCDGELRSCRPIKREGKFRYNHKLIDIPMNGYIRTRKCNKCHKVVKTLEIPMDRYFRDINLVNKLSDLIREYKESATLST